MIAAREGPRYRRQKKEHLQERLVRKAPAMNMYGLDWAHSCGLRQHSQEGCRTELEED